MEQKQCISMPYEKPPPQRVAGVVGEPGVGKSRLYYEFKLRTPHSSLVLETFSVSHGKAYPYLPLLELLKHYFQLMPPGRDAAAARAGDGQAAHPGSESGRHPTLPAGLAGGCRGHRPTGSD